MILIMNLKSSLGVSLSIIHIGAGDSINVSEIVTMCISLLIIHTGADDSNNESEISTRCISLLTIHTGADDFINESEISTRGISLLIIHTGADDSIIKSEIHTSIIMKVPLSTFGKYESTALKACAYKQCIICTRFSGSTFILSTFHFQKV